MHGKIFANLLKENSNRKTVCSLEQHNFATSFWGVIFLLSKFVELGDTAFIVLRKQKLIVLHWLHHVITLVVAWAGMEYYDTHVRFYLMNTFVHSFMYTYYALRALKYRIPRRLAMTLTTLQIFQMICYIFVNGYSLYKMGQANPRQVYKFLLPILPTATNRYKKCASK
ncbi:unnamed protein product [Allacma fusca]|uniref:Elongation of very long chain fatty acids protein n=1 Tax=Allacma fusca TaxID=39272 RepID=A0A8J2LG02_9HEXA|nr:unnamed protein product [Allacma fusca]